MDKNENARPNKRLGGFSPHIVAVSSVGGCRHITHVSVDSLKDFSEAGTDVDLADFVDGVADLLKPSVRFIRGVDNHAASISEVAGLSPLRIRFLLGPGEIGGVDGVDVEVGWEL